MNTSLATDKDPTVKRWRIMGASGLLLASAVIGVTLAPAEALSSNCSAIKQTIVHSGSLDENRSRAICSSIGGDTAVRAQLNRSGGVDYFSPRFTTTNTYNYTGYASCPGGCFATYKNEQR